MDLKLPNELATKQDVVLIHRELNLFIEAALASVMRHDKPVQYPVVSKILQATAVANQIDLHDEGQSRKLLKALEEIKNQAPSLRMSFASEPSPEILQKIISWLRHKIDPHIIIQVGLQPTITAGVILQTSKHRFDLSLRRYLDEHKKELSKTLAGKAAV